MGIPKPFSRPSISLGGGPKKDWQEVETHVLVRGDNVRGYGVIEKIDWVDYSPDNSVITIQWVNGDTTSFSPSDVVTAFTAI